MALSGKERQQRFRQQHVKSGDLVRFEFRIPAAQAQSFRSLAAQWGCSLTEAFNRAVAQAANTAAQPLPEALTPSARVPEEKSPKTPQKRSQTPLKPKLFPSGNGYSVWLGEIIVGSVEKAGTHWLAFASGRRPVGAHYPRRREAVSALIDHGQQQGLLTPASWQRAR